MMRALNTAGTGMVAQQYNLDTIANNLSNVNTTAFKQQRAEFQDLMYQTFKASGAPNGGESIQPIALQVGLGAKFAGTDSNFTAGPPQPTGNPLNMAINGDGFFQVQRPDGSTAYTRDGSFQRDGNGLLVTANGFPLIPNVTIPTGALAVSVSETGVISAIIDGNDGPTPLETIQLAIFPNPGGLTRIGQNLFEQGGASGEPTLTQPGLSGSGQILSGFIEGSNVQVVEEMVRMILAQRAYEINSKAIQTADDMLSVLNNLKR